MVALKIEETKLFTKKLFIGETFDSMLVREAEIVTFNRFKIDGRVHQGYYSADEIELQKIGGFSAWRVLKPFCFSLIKGSKLPESFYLIFQLSPSAEEHFLKNRNLLHLAEQVNGLYINIRYEEQGITCITGMSVKQFTMDKTLDREWDESVKQFLKIQELVFQEQ